MDQTVTDSNTTPVPHQQQKGTDDAFLLKSAVVLMVVGGLVSRIAGTNGVWILSFFLVLFYLSVMDPFMIICPCLLPFVCIHILVIVISMHLGGVLFDGFNNEYDLVSPEENKQEEEIKNEDVGESVVFLQGMICGVALLLTLLLGWRAWTGT